jgi:hypothetical protein
MAEPPGAPELLGLWRGQGAHCKSRGGHHLLPTTGWEGGQDDLVTIGIV